MNMFSGEMSKDKIKIKTFIKFNTKLIVRY